MILYNASLLVSLMSARVVGDVNVHVLLQLRDPELRVDGKAIDGRLSFWEVGIWERFLASEAFVVIWSVLPCRPCGCTSQRRDRRTCSEK